MVTISIQAKTIKLKKEIIRGIIAGIRDALQEYIGTVARDTGQLRLGLETMLLEQVTGLTKQDKAIIDFKTIDVPYAKYHVVGPDLNKYYSPNLYRDPTTAGTKPINPTILMALIKQKIRQNLGQQLEQVKPVRPKEKVKEKPVKKVKEVPEQKKEDNQYQRFLIAFDTINIRERRGNLVPIPVLIKEMGVSITYLQPLLLKWEKERLISLSIASDPSLVRDKTNTIGHLESKEERVRLRNINRRPRGFIHYVQVLRRK